MTESRYKVFIDNIVVAENMDIDTTTILIRALFEKYYNDNDMIVSIKKMDATRIE